MANRRVVWDSLQMGGIAVLLFSAMADHQGWIANPLPAVGAGLALLGLGGAGKMADTVKTGYFDALGMTLRFTRTSRPRTFVFAVAVWSLFSVILAYQGLRLLLGG